MTKMDRFLMSVGIGSSTVFYVLKFSIRVLIPKIEEIKTVVYENIYLGQEIAMTIQILAILCMVIMVIVVIRYRKRSCCLPVFFLLYTMVYSWKIKRSIYECMTWIFCVYLSWCIIGITEKYVLKFGTYQQIKNKK